MSRARVQSTRALAGEVAQGVLADGGGALRAVLAGYFAAAGDSPHILFGPLALVTGGLGSGTRVFDGRCRQAGLKGKRPRGLLPDDDVPPASRVAIPQSIAALAVASAYHQGATLASVARPAVAIAKKAGAPGRARFLDLVASQGPAALSEPSFVRAWVSEFGPVRGGVSTTTDLGPQRLVDVSATEEDLRLTVPFSEAKESPAFGQEEAIVAVDVSGFFAALSFRRLPGDLVLDEFELSVPLAAEPVFRGVPRVTPGSSLPMRASVWLERDGSGRIVRAVAQPRDGDALEVSRDPDTKSTS